MTGQLLPQRPRRSRVRIRLVLLWRRGPESNRAERICNPRSAPGAARLTGRRGSAWSARSARNAACWAISSPFALAACGGGGGDPPPCNAPQLETFGDSTQSYAFATWRAKYGLRVTDHAVSGTSTSSLPRLVVSPGAVAIVNFGLNDSVAGAPVSTTLEQYRANLRILAHAPNAQVIFETPNPSTDPNRNVAPYAQVMREVAAEQGLQLIDTYACFQQQADWQARIPDRVHPDAEGMAYVVNVCAAPVIDALACR